MAKSLPGAYRSETAKGATFNVSPQKDYRKVNNANKMNDGMNKLGPADKGFNSKSKK